PPRRALAGRPGIPDIPIQEVQEISETIALQPRQRGLKLGQGHRGSPLVAQYAFEHGVVAMVQPLPSWDLQVSLILHDLSRDHLANAQAETPLQHEGRVYKFRLSFLALGADFREGGAGPQRGIAQAERVALQRRDPTGSLP